MTNLVLITSVINTPNNPLSYSNIRSIYTPQERFNQTKNTINSIKTKIPNYKILIIECSKLDLEHEDYLKNNSDYYINVYDNEIIRNQIYHYSKSLGEGTMTIEAIKYINYNNIIYKNLYKVSGRYMLTDQFCYSKFNNDMIVMKKINDSNENIFTGLYKLPSRYVNKFLIYLEQKKDIMYQCIGYEVLFSMFLHTISNNDKVYVNPIGLEGYVTVDGSYFNG